MHRFDICWLQSLQSHPLPHGGVSLKSKFIFIGIIKSFIVAITILTSAALTRGLHLRWPSTIASRVAMSSPTKKRHKLCFPETIRPFKKYGQSLKISRTDEVLFAITSTFAMYRFTFFRFIPTIWERAPFCFNL